MIFDKIESSIGINAIRSLAMDAVQRANSGHPGAPMGMAPVAFVLWSRFLRHAPSDPSWSDRDRFVLSCGHASMLLYSLLHLSGYDVSLEDIANFRKWHSKTPGHPEVNKTPGVESTTGPLGQGFGNGVGMALAERMLASSYNLPDMEIVNHRTWILASDGDMMEGVTAEAASLAGTMKLGKLICIYDDNKVTIEGSTDLTFREDVAARFRSYGWNVVEDVNGDNPQSVYDVLADIQHKTDAPSLIITRTTIGYGSPNKSGTSHAHGEPLGDKEIELTKEKIGWEFPPFHCPKEAYTLLREGAERGESARRKWLEIFEQYRGKFPDSAAAFKRDMRREPPSGWDSGLDDIAAQTHEPSATRVASGKVIDSIAKRAPLLVGGSADLGTSNNTLVKERGSFSQENPKGRNIHFGVREHAMGAVTNGIALHGGFIPYAGTFLIFSDYMRASLRLSAISKLKAIFVFTHDSIGLGEDGPTHQPISQLMSLRLIPNFTVFRPADATETVEAWRVAMTLQNPCAIVLTRQKVVQLLSLEARRITTEDMKHGAYIVKDAPKPKVIIIATGSEVAPSLGAAALLESEGVATRVVSMPSWEIFEEQEEGYKLSILPSNIKARVAVEAGVKLGWERYAGTEGEIIGLEGFGVSAPGREVMEKFGFTPQKIAEAARRVIERNNL